MQPHLQGVADRIYSLPKPIITKNELKKLEAVEDAEAARRGIPEFKFATNEEMLQAIGLAEPIR